MATRPVVTESPAAPVAAAPKKATPPTSKHKAAPKPAKKAAAPKAAKAKKAAPEAAEDTRTITPLLKPTANPCKAASFCYAQVHAALTSKTVAEARRKLAADPRNPTKGRALELGWLVKKKFVKVGS
jgi:hypothetical protein